MALAALCIVRNIGAKKIPSTGTLSDIPCARIISIGGRATWSVAIGHILAFFVASSAPQDDELLLLEP